MVDCMTATAAELRNPVSNPAGVQDVHLYVCVMTPSVHLFCKCLDGFLRSMRDAWRVAGVGYDVLHELRCTGCHGRMSGAGPLPLSI